ncbi:MAG: universal stress protein [Armatimonadetes bacterium]|nr:universal stress protein [Armatimonadota bacterium]
MYERILMPLDATDVDNAMIDHIIALAAVHGSHVYLLRIAQYDTRDARAHETEDAQRYLQQVEEKMKASGTQVTSIIGRGDPAEVIVRKAEELDCRLIAMATHGHRFPADLILGSVAERVRHASPVPVLMMRGR